jgi:hypothetical protein
MGDGGHPFARSNFCPQRPIYGPKSANLTHFSAFFDRDLEENMLMINKLSSLCTKCSAGKSLFVPKRRLSRR